MSFLLDQKGPKNQGPVGGNFFDNALPSGSGSLKQSILVADNSANKNFIFHLSHL